MGALLDKIRGRNNNKPTETERRVKANDAEYNATFKYANNYIRTSKYTFLSFLPLNLFEQFQRIANTYFLILLILQVMPVISSLTWVTTVVPLVLVLFVTALKDAYDDIQRHKSDNTVNNKQSYVLRDGSFVTDNWQNVVVGDIIKMESDEFVAADLLLLATSEPNSLCYIETAELDGETNLKVRQALTETAVIAEHDVTELSSFKCDLECEAPNNVLSKFEGILRIDGVNSIPLNNDQMLLRGCVLRNTKWCYGLVVFAGRDTKLMKNSGQAVFKRTRTDRLLNTLIIGIVVFLFSMSLVCVIGCGIWETVQGNKFQVYLPWLTFIPGTRTGETGGTGAAGATVISLLVFFSYLILFNTVVPISLYVSVEFLRLVQSMWINWDMKMYYAPKDTPAQARTTALNEELGQIEYIFSDKTGTLTQNIMTFNKCSIQGRSFGDPVDNEGNPSELTENTPKCDLSANKYYDKLVWYDNQLLKCIKKRDEGVVEFFKLLSLCHTVMPEEKNGKLVYQAQSPDEEALVGAARDFGFVFKSRSPTTITVETLGEEQTYELLCILDFNNVRKRMSVIVRKDNKILLLCKGADTTVNARLDKSSEKTLELTCTHLNEYANIGLRTLTLAYKELDQPTYTAWKEKHYEASIAMSDRDDKLHDVYELIETDMKLIGATAIEDKLQDGVPDAIANLANAGIKIWVLTGDKQETAINIGYSCKLLTDEMEEVFVIDGEAMEDVEKQLTSARDRMLEIKREFHMEGSSSEPHHANGGGIEQASHTERRGNSPSDEVNIAGSLLCEARYFSSVQLVSFHENTNVEASPAADTEEFGGFGVVINGHSLVAGLSDQLELLLLEVGCMCKAVICCRVTPLQKAQVVELVKNHKKSVTLAIGDGANDVSMIKTAHIGVGISGQEGMQAVLSSDFSFAQFRYLERLLLVHGRWSYLRMCKFLAYFFYKNFSFTLTHFWYAWFIGFSAQTIFDEMFIALYNVVYTSMPVLMIGVFDKDVGADYSTSYPKLYAPGLVDMWFNKKRFALSLLEGLATSCTLFFVTYGCLEYGIRHDGLDAASGNSFAFMSATILIMAVTIRCALDTYFWTPLNHLFIWGSAVIFFLIHLFFYSDTAAGIFGTTMVGTLRFVAATPTYWLGVLLAVTTLMVPVLCANMWRLTTDSTLSDRLRLRASFARSKSQSRSMILRPKTSIRREFRTQSIRSGYAFAHEEGFGEFITSGRYLRKTDSVEHPPHPSASHHSERSAANVIVTTSSTPRANVIV